ADVRELTDVQSDAEAGTARRLAEDACFVDAEGVLIHVRIHERRELRARKLGDERGGRAQHVMIAAAPRALRQRVQREIRGDDVRKVLPLPRPRDRAELLALAIGLEPVAAL